MGHFEDIIQASRRLKYRMDLQKWKDRKGIYERDHPGEEYPRPKPELNTSPITKADVEKAKRNPVMRDYVIYRNNRLY